MQGKTIDNALLTLRKQTIRGDRDGLTQVEALLAMRGVAMPHVLPAKRSDVAWSHAVVGAGVNQGWREHTPRDSRVCCGKTA